MGQLLNLMNPRKNIKTLAGNNDPDKMASVIALQRRFTFTTYNCIPMTLQALLTPGANVSLLAPEQCRNVH